MTSDAEARLLEMQLANLRHRFDDQASPLVARLSELRQQYGTDQHLLIPRQPHRRTIKDRLPRQF